MTESAETPGLDRRQSGDIVEPPTSLWAIVRQIGPGLIIAANIVGSGELIMTTKTGAQAGIALLWLILIGCLVKVFVQLELGRFTISHGETTLSALSRVPGPRLKRVNWVVLLWAIMMLTTVGQLGGIVGGVGQAMALTFPFTGDYRDAVRIPAETDIQAYAKFVSGGADSEVSPEQAQRDAKRMAWIKRDLDALGDHGTVLLNMAIEGQPLVDEKGNSLTELNTIDQKIWVIVIGFLTAWLLFVGRYRLIERFAVVLVVSFTVITMGNVISLQQTDQYALSGEYIMRGLMFGLPEGKHALLTALATFGIIGVGATELISYPYWCLEKGYARSAGPRESNDAWLKRAVGWYRVMKFDAFASMVIYTIATAAFFLMGVAVLHSEGRDPEKNRLVSTLAESYVPVFGEYARWLFLFGAIAVLYSTYLVANASNARMVADFIGVLGLSTSDADSTERRRLVTIWSVILPLACVVVFLTYEAPVLLIATAGMAQAVMLPVIGISSIYFRYRETDVRLRPGVVWDTLLITSCLALLIAGTWGLYEAWQKLAPAAPAAAAQTASATDTSPVTAAPK
ncbi:MAG: Nramp family divalent metal transporter [Planctomycetaceae bacterium]